MGNHKTLNIAHRGASGYAPENTMAAFQLALDMGADGIELDVQMSRDGQLVVMHDEMLDRTTNLTGRLTDQFMDYLRTADAGAWYGPQFKGEKLPLLQDVIDLIRGRGVLNIEIKLHRAEDMAMIVPLVDLLKAESFHDVILTSFVPQAIAQVREMAPQFATGLLTITPEHLDDDIEWEYICPRYTMLNPDISTQLHEQGLKILSWTVNEKEHMQAMLEQNVYGIITNVPDVLKKI